MNENCCLCRSLPLNSPDMEFSSRKRLCDQFYYLLTKESVCFDRPEY